MKIALLLLALLPFVAVAQKESPDEAAIRKGILILETGWNEGSGAKFASSFAEDADYVVVDGMHIKGRKVIQQGHDHIFATVYKGSANKASIKSVRFLSPDIAVAHVEWSLRWGGDKSSRAMNSMVWQKNGGKWEIVSFHNTPITPQRH